MSRLSNGELLKVAADQGFDLLLTVDQNIRYEHRLESLPIAVLELNTRDSRLPALEAMSAHFESALEATQSYLFVSLEQDGRIARDAPRYTQPPSR